MPDDYLIFRPDDVDLRRSPLRGHFPDPTFVLGAFNPGFTRLPDGNLLLMVRVAEALREPVAGGQLRAIRWTPAGYVLDRYPLDRIDRSDPRTFRRKDSPLLGLTSLSWLLPVELAPDARTVRKVHYERAIQPAAAFQAYGIEDARISRIGAHWWMTVCVVSPERQGTALYRSDNGLDYTLLGLVLDHQNKDMLLFEGKPGGMFMALTRPLGENYFLYPEDSPWLGGPAIQLAQSPDALHWKPLEAPGLRARKDHRATVRIGGGSPPVLTPQGWLVLYHAVEQQDRVGNYRTFAALLDRDDPTRVLQQPEEPLLEAAPSLTASIAHRLYLPTPVVFTTGIADGGGHWIIASGEADLACRISHIPKDRVFSGCVVRGGFLSG